MADLVFSSWGGKVVDSRKGQAAPESIAVPKALSMGTPFHALIGWDGLAVWGPGVDPIDLARAYATTSCRRPSARWWTITWPRDTGASKGPGARGLGFGVRVHKP